MLGTVQGAKGNELALEVKDGVSKTGGQGLLISSSPSGFMSPDPHSSGTWVLWAGLWFGCSELDLEAAVRHGGGWSWAAFGYDGCNLSLRLISCQLPV